MATIDIGAMQERLEKEKAALEAQLGSHGSQDEETKDWQGSADTAESDTADENVVADAIEELSTNTAVVEELERRLHMVTKALERIENGTYGTCEVGGEAIEAERLEANPAARTCKAHMEEEGTLVQ